MLRDVPIDLQDMFVFSHSPVDMGKPWLLRSLRMVGTSYTATTVLPLTVQ